MIERLMVSMRENLILYFEISRHGLHRENPSMSSVREDLMELFQKRPQGFLPDKTLGSSIKENPMGYCQRKLQAIKRVHRRLCENT